MFMFMFKFMLMWRSIVVIEQKEKRHTHTHTFKKLLQNEKYFNLVKMHFYSSKSQNYRGPKNLYVKQIHVNNLI